MHQHYKLLSVTFSLYQPTFYQIPIYSTAKGKGGPHETAGMLRVTKIFPGPQNEISINFRILLHLN